MQPNAILDVPVLPALPMRTSPRCNHGLRDKPPKHDWLFMQICRVITDDEYPAYASLGKKWLTSYKFVYAFVCDCRCYMKTYEDISVSLPFFLPVTLRIIDVMLAFPYWHLQSPIYISYLDDWLESCVKRPGWIKVSLWFYDILWTGRQT